MKYYKRLKIYKESNVTFNPETFEARSYRHWLFVRKIKGKIIFNAERYSQSTSRHQRKLESLLDELGEKIYLTVYSRSSLDDFKISFLSQYYHRLGYYQSKLKHGNIRENTKESLRNSIENIKKDIKTMRSLGAICYRDEMNENIKKGKQSFLSQQLFAKEKREEERKRLEVLTKKCFNNHTVSNEISNQ